MEERIPPPSRALGGHDESWVGFGGRNDWIAIKIPALSLQKNGETRTGHPGAEICGPHVVVGEDRRPQGLKPGFALGLRAARLEALMSQSHNADQH